MDVSGARARRKILEIFTRRPDELAHELPRDDGLMPLSHAPPPPSPRSRSRRINSRSGKSVAIAATVAARGNTDELSLSLSRGFNYPAEFYFSAPLSDFGRGAARRLAPF
jgi:hypothetical protein